MKVNDTKNPIKKQTFFYNRKEHARLFYKGEQWLNNHGAEKDETLSQRATYYHLVNELFFTKVNRP